MDRPATDPGREVDPPLLAALRAAADPTGFVRFDRFMEIALYLPGAGYYTRAGTPLGRDGDFYTAAHASELFGATLAATAAREHARLGRPPGFRVVEVGAGDGTLARAFLEEVAASPDFAAAEVEYDLLERDPVRASRLAEELTSRRPSESWSIRAAPSVGSLGPFEGVIVANELLDALPCRRFEWRDGGFVEFGVEVGKTGVRAAERPVPDGALDPPLPDGLEPGQSVEVSPLAEAFVREVGDHLVRGSAYLFDYGDEEAPLLARHPRGTLRSVRAHREAADPLAEVGRTDLSVFVNFSRLSFAARRVHLTEVAFERQAEALGRLGIEAVFARRAGSLTGAEEKVRLQLGLKNLLFGFDQFRLLELRAG